VKFAYLAGYIDGDGSIFCRVYLQKPKLIKVYESSLQICSVDKKICNYFIDEFGGAIHQRPEKRANRRDTWLWYVKGTRCKEILESCLPFLILKRNSSTICCSLIQEISKTKFHRGKKVPKESHEYRTILIDQIKKEIHMNDRVNEQNFILLKEIKKTKTPSNADLAYIAGLIDAEGCFRIQHWKSKREGRSEDWVISLEIGNTKYPIFPWLLERFGGSVIYRKPTGSRQNPMVIWSLRSDALYQILMSIYPFLRVKKERCEKLGQFHQTRIPNGGDRKSSAFKAHVADLCMTRRQLFDEFQVLNKKGKH
jgi:hypothetical protein